MGLFERYLSVWVGLCIAAGVGLGVVLPSLFDSIARIEYASVNLVIAVFIWVMIYPMMVNVDFASLNMYLPDWLTRKQPMNTSPHLS